MTVFCLAAQELVHLLKQFRSIGFHPPNNTCVVAISLVSTMVSLSTSLSSLTMDRGSSLAVVTAGCFFGRPSKASKPLTINWLPKQLKLKTPKIMIPSSALLWARTTEKSSVPANTANSWSTTPWRNYSFWNYIYFNKNYFHIYSFVSFFFIWKVRIVAFFHSSQGGHQHLPSARRKRKFLCFGFYRRNYSSFWHKTKHNR